MTIINVVVVLNASIIIKKKQAKCISALGTSMLQTMENSFPENNPAIASIKSDIKDLKSSMDLLNKVESSINTANKANKKWKLVNKAELVMLSNLCQWDKFRYKTAQKNGGDSVQPI